MVALDFGGLCLSGSVVYGAVVKKRKDASNFDGGSVVK